MLHSTIYLVTALPSSLVGCSHVMRRSLDESRTAHTCTLLGRSGTARGISDVGDDTVYSPTPAALIARTRR